MPWPFTPLTPLTYSRSCSPLTPFVTGLSSFWYLSQFAKMLPILGELVSLYTSSKYSLVNSKGLAVTFGIYLPTSLLGSIVVLLIFLRRKDRKGLTPDRKKVEWNG